MMKYVYVAVILTVSLLASIMPKEEALSLFAQIRNSEYNWVLAQWRNHINVKMHSRSSSRHVTWKSKNQGEQPSASQIHDPLREVGDTQQPASPPVDPITVPDI